LSKFETWLEISVRGLHLLTSRASFVFRKSFHMKVANTQPFKIIYSILNHEYLGYILESFVVQLSSLGNYTYQFQNISSKNISEFKSKLDSVDFELVDLIEEIQQEAILKIFNKRKLTAVDFFLKTYDPQKGDKGLQESIGNYIESKKSQIVSKLKGKDLFIMGSDGNPLWKAVVQEKEKATIRFHFIRNPDNTHYFPSIRFKNEKLDFQYKNAILLADNPAFLLIDNRLYTFNGHVDGKKIKPFLGKKFIAIPSNVEEQYYKKFVAPLMEQYDVVTKGLEIKNHSSAFKTILSFCDTSSTPLSDLQEANMDATGLKLSFRLSYQYGAFNIPFDHFTTPYSVSMEKREQQYIFNKIKRNSLAEKNFYDQILDLGLPIQTGKTILARGKGLEWLQTHATTLESKGILVQQENPDARKYFIGYTKLDIKIQEINDWFDIHAHVQFGEFEIPFLQLRKYILSGIHEFTLPNGEIAVIPEAWFTQYSELFAFSEPKEATDRAQLKMHHLTLVQELQDHQLAETILSRKIQKLHHFENIQTHPIPEAFNGTLRPYQQAGYDWLKFLQEYRFGGCLADDMGLGKTIQTLAMLQSEKEKGVRTPSLLILPTSLLYNWTLEAAKFTPNLSVFLYTGTNREKNTTQFDNFDLIITSYGIVRLDIEILKKYNFNYLILDESQAIKNPTSIIAKAVKKLNGTHRLILTGTPIENSTTDLWSQISFINPGLLGSQAYFKSEFQIPIEKKKDEEKMQKLHKLLKPFILRRLKSQVATDLPEKVESIAYSEMSEAQENAYEEAKAFYRNSILESIDKDGINKSQFIVLQGLTKLRQIANHPLMVNPDYDQDSGKFEDIFQRLQTILSEGHKVLVFSQFIKHLDLFRARLDAHKTRYAYLDGSTKNRQEQVELFQNHSDIPLFLISLKAGGVGLNLTAADYVFILDPWWNPAIEAQAIDRAHRIGQDKTVFTYKFISKNTVEEKILALQQSKKQLADGLISNEESFIKTLTKEDVLNLLL
jgi:SNF2 family DNA or RNA helicase